MRQVRFYVGAGETGDGRPIAMSESLDCEAQALGYLATMFGGATAFRGQGAWDGSALSGITREQSSVFEVLTTDNLATFIRPAAEYLRNLYSQREVLVTEVEVDSYSVKAANVLRLPRGGSK